tara:strand:- start:1433 stop:2074 length:642 start_codon:yes stop_codon:yes gene_type:complete
VTYFKESLFFDLKRRTDTSIRVKKNHQYISNASTYLDADGLLYVASFTSVIKKTLEITLNIIGNDSFSRYQFIDLGCGKGKSIIFFLEKFIKTKKFNPIGIEYDERLYNIAKNNLFNICNYQKGDLDLILDSATNLEKYVSSTNLVVYLYNSFQGETLNEVLRILKNFNHIIIYIDPAEEDKLINYNYKIIARNKGKYNADTWTIAQRNFNEK